MGKTDGGIETPRAAGYGFIPKPHGRNTSGLQMVTIVHLITGLDTGGAERMLSRLVAHADRDRFRSLVVSMTNAGTIGPTLNEAGIELISLGMRRGMPNPRGLLRLACILREVRADILQTWLYHADCFGLMAQQLGKVPHLVWNLRCSDIALSPIAAAVRRILSRCSAMPDSIIVNSRAGRRFHESIGYHPRRWEFIPNGFDTVEFAPDLAARRRIRSELGIARDTIVIGFPARYHPMKDHSTFFSAATAMAAECPGVCFLLAGPGIESTNRPLARAIAECGMTDRVRLLGERCDMPAVYAAFDIATLSSAWGEGFPNVLGEAMACGLPCAATDSGDTRELLGDSGFVVPPRDPEALVEAWKMLIAMGKEGRHSLGAAARARIIREYDLGRIVKHYEALYVDITTWHGVARISRPAASPGAQHPPALARFEPPDVPGQ